MKARGFIDTGTEMSCVSSHLASSVKAKRKRQTTFIVLFGAASCSHCDIITTIQLQPSSGDVPAIPMSMVVVDKILDSLPSSPVNSVRSLPCLAGLELSDPEFDQPGRVDLLIGLDNMANLEMRILELDTPKGLMVASFRLQHLVFGVPPNSSSNALAPIYTLFTLPSSSGEGISRFWELEEVPSSEPGLSLEDHQVVDHF